VAGLGNKDKEFWDRLKSWDAMVLMLPERYIWRILDAKRRNKKGRAIWTYTGRRGESVIDYVLVDEEAREEMWLCHGGEEGKSERVKVRRRESDEEDRVVFREMLGEVVWRAGKGNESMKETKRRIREVLGNTGKERDKERKRMGW
ncbi:hypothetical protein ALC57_02585, partial [Trachymyrmex cornetzi]